MQGLKVYLYPELKKELGFLKKQGTVSKSLIEWREEVKRLPSNKMCLILYMVKAGVFSGLFCYI